VANQSGASGTSTRIDAFSVLGRFVVRAPWLMIAAWIVVVGVLAVAFPPLTKVVESQKAQLLPPKAMAAAEQMAKDFGESAQNVLIVVLTDNRGLQPGDEDAYRKLAATLRADTNEVTGVRDVRSTPALRPMMVSADNKAFYLAVNLRAPAGSPESSRAYQRITEIAKRCTAGSPLTADVTGQAAMVGDLSIVGARDMHRIEIATALLVLIILLVIYRRPVTVLLPLITIGISVASAQGVVSALTQHGLGVSALTIALMTAMIVGAGTDYAVFLISRYHEYIRSGADSDLAVQQALSSIGKVIAASAATVAITFCGMVFTRLPAFTSVGPALAVSIGIALLAAVTLLPRHPGARGSTRMGDAATGAHRPAVAAVSHSDRSPAQNPSADQFVGVDRAGRLRGLPAAHLQRPPAITAIGAKQRRLFDDGKPLLDEYPSAAIHLRTLAPRPADIAGPGRPGPNGATRGSAAQHRRGARHHATYRRAARSDQAQLSSRTGRHQPRERLDTDQRPNHRPRRADRWRRPTRSKPGRGSRPNPKRQRAHDRAHHNAEPGAAAARHSGPTAGHHTRTRERQRVRFDARRQRRRLGGPDDRRFEQQSAMQRRPGVQRRPLPPRRACPGAKQRHIGHRAECGGTQRAVDSAASEHAVGNGRRQSAGTGHQ